MLPFGLGGKSLEKMLKKAGIKMYEIADAKRVIIETEEERIVIEQPKVIEIEVPGSAKAYQVIAQDVRVEKIEREGASVIEISDEDVKIVAEETGCSEEVARKALEETKGDIAEAILKLQESGC
ncbi:NagC family transcriptional regulator [Ignicoccus islandicus DSM 13165]|uniref:Nascent polypeptide-associated complex protein n=1 Tax=Ignicoccus islandicus DSM 13165 TaxID=940295 RepID=A0A0U3FQ07_9CREN|nr:NagC family transcriptional regulator [Ignicoccus islandicus DSM 13165]